MNAGPLRHVVEIQAATGEQDPDTGDDDKVFGEGTSAFAAGVRASIHTLRGNELFNAQQEFAEATVEIGIRYLAGVNERMRVKHDPAACCIVGADESLVRYYNILNVNDVDERHFDMLLTCSTGISATK